MLNLLTYCGFVITSLIVIAAFITSTTYAQLAVAILLYPPLVYVAFKVFPRKASCCLLKKQASTIEPPMQSSEIEELVKNEGTIGIKDLDKRMFLKLIGGVGLSLFLFSLFNKKAEGLFFKSLPPQEMVSLKDIAGNKIDPAQNQPMDGYNICEVDDNDNIVTYYGFTNKDGAWFVMKEDTENGSYRYAQGTSNFPVNWGNHENLKYGYFSTVF